MTAVLLIAACSTAADTPGADVDLRSNPVRAGAAQWTWPSPGDPRSRILVAGFRDDVPTDRTLTVRVDSSTPAQRVTLMQEITSLDHVLLSDGISVERVEFISTTDKPPDTAECWLPILNLPSGELMVAGSGRPARHWQRGEHHLVATAGCTTTPSTVAAVVSAISSRCDATAVAVDGTLTWGEVRPWLEALDAAALLVERPEVLSSNAAAVHGRCEGAIEVDELRAP
ncbi:MAG: hypothetical protein R3F61_33995 [Myxococcota bacterium]